MTPGGPRDMIGLFRVACGLWIGVSLFFTFGVAKSLFAVFPAAEAGEITRVLFPSYYQSLYLAGALAAIGMGLGHAVCPRWRVCLILVLLAVLFIATIDFMITPVMDGLRLPSDRARFGRLHGLSMVLNLLGLAAVGVAVIVGRRRTGGPAEVGEEEHAR